MDEARAERWRIRHLQAGPGPNWRSATRALKQDVRPHATEQPTVTPRRSLTVTIHELCSLSNAEAAKRLAELELSERDSIIAEQVLKEIKARLGFLLDVGLDYLTLSRGATPLAGGEAQRIRLASQVGSGLVGGRRPPNLLP